jgi:hypothetical protein
MTDRVTSDLIKAIPLTVVESPAKELGEDKIARNRANFADAPVLRKPFRHEDLVDTIRGLLDP